MGKKERLNAPNEYLRSATQTLTQDSAYLLAPITTGPWLYSALAKHQLKTFHELITQKKSETVLEVIKPNIADILSQKRTIQPTTPYHLLTVGEIGKPESWTSEDVTHLAFFKQIINEKIKEVYLGKGWDYSAFCLELVASALRKQFLEQHDMSKPGLDPARQKNFRKDLSSRCPVVIYDHTCEPILLERIIDQSSTTIAKIFALGFSTHAHADAYRRIYRVAELFDGNTGTDVNPPYTLNLAAIKEAHAKFERRAG